MGRMTTRKKPGAEHWTAAELSRKCEACPQFRTRGENHKKPKTNPREELGPTGGMEHQGTHGVCFGRVSACSSMLSLAVQCLGMKAGSLETWKPEDTFIFEDKFNRIILNELYLFPTNALIEV